MMTKWEYCMVWTAMNQVVVTFYLQSGESTEITKPARGEQSHHILAKTICDLGKAGWEAYSVVERHTWHFKRQLP
jgi:hypothetical protein